MKDLRLILKSMRKLDSQLTEFIDTTDYHLIDPLSELQENLQEVAELIRTDIKAEKDKEELADE